MIRPTRVTPWAIAALAFVFGLLFDVLFYKHQPGISVPIFVFVFSVGVIVFDRLGNRRLREVEHFLMLLGFVNSFFFILHLDATVHAFNVLFLFYAWMLVFLQLYGFRLKVYQLFDYVFSSLFHWLTGLMHGFGVLGSLKLSSRKHLGAVLRGVAIGLPFVIVFVALFVSADAAFAQILQGIISPEQLANVLYHVVITAIATLFFVATLGAAFWSTPEVKERSESPGMVNAKTEALVVLVMSNIVFALFIVARSYFLFGGEAVLSNYDLTYAEYARAGFFQLLAVSGIVAAMLVCFRYVKHGALRVWNTMLTGLLSLQTLVILGSAWTALALYDATFGFTLSRFYAHVVMILIAVVLVLLFASLAFKLADRFVALGVIFTVGVMIFGMNLIQPERFVINQNLARFDAGESFDMRYVANKLGPAATYYTLLELSKRDAGLLERSAVWEVDPTRSIQEELFENSVNRGLWKLRNAKPKDTPQSWNVYRRAMIENPLHGVLRTN